MTAPILCDQPDPATFVKVPGKCNHLLVDRSRLCRRKAGQGTEHDGYGCCWLHGGRQESHNKAARELAAQDALLRIVGDKGQAVQDPEAELSRLAGEAVALKDAAAQLVSDLGDLLAPGDNPDIHPYVKLYERAMVELRKTLTDLAKLGFTERQVQVDEAIASVVVAKVLETFAELGQDPAPYVAVLGPKLAALDAVTTSGSERNTP